MGHVYADADFKRFVTIDNIGGIYILQRLQGSADVGRGGETSALAARFSLLWQPVKRARELLHNVGSYLYSSNQNSS